MEKYSDYNIIVPFADGYNILYNSVSGYYCLLNPSTSGMIPAYEHRIPDLAADHPDIYRNLLRNGSIVPESLDEFQMVETIKFERRFSSRQYEIIVNPTMDCNLGCWYCYESHLPGSEIDDRTVRNIIRHLHVKYDQNPFKTLVVSFFGGEPLLKEKRVVEIVDGAEKFCLENDVKLLLEFTTNCTVLTDTILNRLQNLQVSFQITFDGDRNKHDRTRHYKNSDRGSYDKITANMKRLAEALTDYRLRVRFNCDNDTLNNKAGILDNLDFLDRGKACIGIHRIWQVGEETIDKAKILEFIQEASQRNFRVEFMPLGRLRENICYADLHNEAVINYDGNVFKCTARSFADQDKYGVLTDSGHILWNIDRIRKRMFQKTPDICRPCKLYPSCTGICLQHLLEAGEMQECNYLRNISMEELITINFQISYLQKNIQRL